jgi:hypothetical protein
MRATTKSAGMRGPCERLAGPNDRHARKKHARKRSS